MTANSLSLTLHVSDVEQSVAFYGLAFDREPEKHFHEFAEFAVPDLGLVIGLLHVNRYPGMPVHKLAIRFADSDELDAVVSRLELADVPLAHLGAGTVVTTDPDGNSLTLSAGENESATIPETTITLGLPVARAVWEHRICTPIPAAIPHGDGTLDEICLMATFNGNHPPAAIAGLLAEARRALKPGGRVLVSGLVGDRAAASVELPGLASRMKCLPVEHAPMTALAEAGFIDLHFHLFGDIICFQVPGIDMRKIRLTGVKPSAFGSADEVEVAYLGPLAEVVTDDGVMFRRGVPERIAAELWNRIRIGPAAGQFELAEYA